MWPTMRLAYIAYPTSLALRSANAKFRRRFAACERLANGRDLARMTPEELDGLWEAAKREERQGA